MFTVLTDRLFPIVIICFTIVFTTANCSNRQSDPELAVNHREIVRDYYQAFKNADRNTLEHILAKDLIHASPFGIYTDRDSMLDAIWPTIGITRAESLRVLGSPPDFMVRYRVVGGERPPRYMSEYIRFHEGRIAEIEVFAGRELKMQPNPTID